MPLCTQTGKLFIISTVLGFMQVSHAQLIDTPSNYQLQVTLPPSQLNDPQTFVSNYSAYKASSSHLKHNQFQGIPFDYAYDYGRPIRQTHFQTPASTCDWNMSNRTMWLKYAAVRRGQVTITSLTPFEQQCVMEYASTVNSRAIFPALPGHGGTGFNEFYTLEQDLKDKPILLSQIKSLYSVQIDLCRHIPYLPGTAEADKFYRPDAKQCPNWTQPTRNPPPADTPAPTQPATSNSSTLPGLQLNAPTAQPQTPADATTPTSPANSNPPASPKLLQLFQQSQQQPQGTTPAPAPNTPAPTPALPPGELQLTQ